MNRILNRRGSGSVKWRKSNRISKYVANAATQITGLQSAPGRARKKRAEKRIITFSPRPPVWQPYRNKVTDVLTPIVGKENHILSRHVLASTNVVKRVGVEVMTPRHIQEKVVCSTPNVHKLQNCSTSRIRTRPPALPSHNSSLSLRNTPTRG